MNTSNSNSSFNPSDNVVSGSGVWAPGKTVREIEGHFHPENEPKDAVPISGTGGVPKVDFNPLHHGQHGQHSSSGSGLTGTHSGSGLTGSHAGTGSGLTGDNTHHSSTTGSGLAGSHHDNSTHDGKKPSIAEKVKDTVTGDKSGKDYDSNRDHHTDNAVGLTGQTGKTGHSDYTGTTVVPVGTTGSSSTATHGATHGISDSAERDLQSSSGRGLTGQTGHSTGAPVVAGTGAGAPGSVARTDESGGSGIATHLRNEADNRAHGHTGDATTGRTGDVTTGRTGDVPATNAMTGSTTGAHDTTASHGTAGHSSTTHGNNNTTSGTDSPKKEGFLAKVKNALH